MIVIAAVSFRILSEERLERVFRTALHTTS